MQDEFVPSLRAVNLPDSREQGQAPDFAAEEEDPEREAVCTNLAGVHLWLREMMAQSSARAPRRYPGGGKTPQLIPPPGPSPSGDAAGALVTLLLAQPLLWRGCWPVVQKHAALVALFLQHFCCELVEEPVVVIGPLHTN
eukprot:425188-Prorocentrum_minimum.AAC.1